MTQSILRDQSYQIAGVTSLVFHGLIFGLTVFAFPSLVKDPILPPPPIQVEFIREEEGNTKPPAPQEDRPRPPAKMTAEAPPDLSTPPEPEAEPAPAVPPPPSETPPPEAEAEPEPAPKVPPKVPRKPAPPKPSPPPEDAFSSLLKNLTPDAEDQPAPVNRAEKEDQSPIEQRANQISMSEEDALRAQLARCWNVMAGAKMAEDLVVRVLVQMNPDRTVYQTSILDKSRYNSDSHFRAAADSALRALRNPACTPLELPPEKFEQWKTLIIRFDPKDML